MKKIFLFAAAAALLTACSSEELSNSEVAQQNNAETPVAFSIYTPRSVTRAGQPETITTASLKTGDHKAGFGVFGYFTDNGTYSETSTPNFMYNQQVKWNDGETAWMYEPVKYWPNEYGNAATSDDVDRVTFFAYAPWTPVSPATGIPTAGVTEDERNITAMTKNTATGDPIIKYVVDPDGITSVDLLWGVYAGQTQYHTAWGTAEATVQPGMPFIDLLKPNAPETTAYTDWTADLKTAPTTDNKVRFNLCHALAKLQVTIDYFDDSNGGGTYGVTGALEGTKQTKIWIREIKIGGFMMKGALNLNSTAAKEIDPDGTPGNGDEYKIGVPNWKAYDGVSDLEYEETTFKDGRKDGREGAIDGENSSEKFLGLNPTLIQSTEYKLNTPDDGKFEDTWFNDNKGVTVLTQPLFGAWDATNKKWIANNSVKPIFVIPMDKPIDISIVYDVETYNPKLAGKLSDNLTPGKSVENKIFKTSAEIFNTTNPVNMEAGKFYDLKLHLGMTSVKVDAAVTAWDDENGLATLPANQ